MSPTRTAFLRDVIAAKAESHGRQLTGPAGEALSQAADAIRELAAESDDLAALRLEHKAWGVIIDTTRAARDEARAEVAKIRDLLGAHLNGWVEATTPHPDQPEMGPMPTLIDGVARALEDLTLARAEAAALRAQVAEAADAARRAERDRCADIVNGWHISKGGYTELAHVLRTTPK